MPFPSSATPLSVLLPFGWQFHSCAKKWHNCGCRCQTAFYEFPARPDNIVLPFHIPAWSCNKLPDYSNHRHTKNDYGPIVLHKYAAPAPTMPLHRPACPAAVERWPGWSKAVPMAMGLSSAVSKSVKLCACNVSASAKRP